MDTVRFGYYRHVNRGGGAEPLFAERRGAHNEFVLGFDVSETDLGDDRTGVRLVGKFEETHKPVFGTIELDD